MATSTAESGFISAVRILFVEDDPQMLRAMIPALAVNGHKVEAVRTAREAMAEMVLPKWDAVILDLGLPDGDGSDMIEPMCQLGLAVIVITARDDPAEREKALGRGAAAFLLKPFPSPELVRLVEALT